ncbi:DUF1990 family protein [Bounagaea algeriensis]
MRMLTVPRPGVSVLRWLFGIALVSWRYLWQITPLHRTERRGDPRDDAPPPLPVAQLDDQVQLADDGVGTFFHRRFHVEITQTAMSAEQLVRRIMCDFQRYVPSEVVTVRESADSNAPLQVGDEFVIEMPGPWNGPVRVVSTTSTCLRLATLRGHLEAGQVQFSAHDERAGLSFAIDAWARPSTTQVRWLYGVLRLAKEVQLNMWVRFCKAMAADAGGHLQDGVWIRTLGLPAGTRVQAVR